nr:alpha/beta hydrolase [Microlunatus panaciterrae]
MARYRGQQLHWSGCQKTLECTTALVPLDYAHLDGPAITLALSRRASTSGHRLGSLFINPGGPGGSGVEYTGYFKHKGLEDYDIVGWDPRGVGQSTPVECLTGKDLENYTEVDNSPDNASEDKAWIDVNREFGASCLRRSGALLEHVSTPETVRDLDLLRGLVGDRKLNYFGSSYGTYIGALYAQTFPKNVGRMVLDGAVNITDDETVSQTEGFDRALNNFASWCASQGCRLGATTAAVLKSIIALWDDLDRNALPVGSRELTQSLAVTGVALVLYENEDSWKYLREGLEDAVFKRDGSYLLYFADLYNQRDRRGNYGQSNYSFPAVRCLDTKDKGVTGARADAAKDAKRAPSIGRFFGPDMTCPMWPVAAVPDHPKIVAAGAAPIVVIGTTGDPATPYEFAQMMAKQLESGVLVTLKGEGHLAYGQSTCIQQIAVAYLVKGTVPRNGTTC